MSRECSKIELHRGEIGRGRSSAMVIFREGINGTLRRETCSKESIHSANIVSLSFLMSTETLHVSDAKGIFFEREDEPL